MLRIIAGLFALLISASAYGQGAVLQGGPWAPGHVPMYVGQGGGQAVVQDSGPAGGGTTGLGASEFLLTARGTGTPPFVAQGSGPGGTNLCDYDAPTSNPTGYHYICLSANATVAGLTGTIITIGSGGATSPIPFYLCVNGTCGTGSGGILTLTVGSTTITNGTNSAPLFDNAGVLGNGSISSDWTNYFAPYTGSTSLPQTTYNAERVSILEFGAIPGTAVGNAPVNANALLRAIATGKRVDIPFPGTSAACLLSAPQCGYNFGNFTTAVPSGTVISCENNQTIIYGQGNTSAQPVFYVSGNAQRSFIMNCVGQMGINGVDAVAGTTFIRFATALAPVNQVTVQNVHCQFVQECVGDEGVNPSSFIDLIDVYTTSTYGRQFHLAKSNGFVNLTRLNCDFSVTALSVPAAWSCGRFSNAVGLFVNDWIAVTNSGTGSVYNSAIVGWEFDNVTRLVGATIKADSVVGDGCLFKNVNAVTITNLDCGFNLGTQATFTASDATTGISISNASPAIVTWTGHGFAPYQPVYFTGSVPSGLNANVIYYVVAGVSLTTNSFEVSANPGGAALNTSASASGLSGFSPSFNIELSNAIVYGGNANQAASKAGLVLSGVVNVNVSGTSMFSLTGDAIQAVGPSANINVTNHNATGNLGNWFTVGANVSHVRVNGGSDYGNGGDFANSGTDACVGFVSGVTETCGVPLSVVTGFGANVATWLATPSSANLAGALTDETGTGSVVFGTAPTFTTSIGITPTVVNSLPTCNSGSDGIRAFVTNNNTGVSFGGAVTTGGTTHSPVYCDGSASAWKQG